MTEQDINNSSTSSVDKIISHQLFVVEKNPIKDKAWEKQQEKALQQQSPKFEVKEAHKPKMIDVSSSDLQTLKIWYDSKPFTKELNESLRRLPKTLFSDDTIEYYIKERVKKEEEIFEMALATV